MAIGRFPLNILDDGGAADGDRLVWNATLGMWVPQASSALVDPTTTKGDLLVHGATGLDRLGVGTNGQVLTADSTAADGVKWAAAGGGSGSSWPPGSADKTPTSPNSKDDEFDGSSTSTWTNTPTAPAAWTVDTDRASHLHLKATSAQAGNTVGKVQATPASYPYTVTTKLAGHNIRTNYSFTGLILAPAGTLTATSLMFCLGPQFNSGSSSLSIRRGSNNFGGTGTFSETVAPAGWQSAEPVYLRATVNSSTSVDLLISFDGWSWVALQTGFNPGFTPGAMGLAASYNSGATVDAYFDFFRIT